MDASTIGSKSFTEAMRGYKKEEVDEFLDDVSQEFAKLKSINSELEKKLAEKRAKDTATVLEKNKAIEEKYN